MMIYMIDFVLAKIHCDNKLHLLLANLAYEWGKPTLLTLLTLSWQFGV